MPRLIMNFKKEIRSLVESSFSDWLLHEIAIVRCDREVLLVENSFLTEVSWGKLIKSSISSISKFVT